ncbi:hypothetical protein LCGC14_0722080 [marine sediment metagenome]|uniref:Uncharacterized protein n=1 Tax=marine sediment metagenome TaxID=412755 RepID=A0A0F9QX22_9ZZZZ
MKPLLIHGTVHLGRLVLSFHSRWRWDYGTTSTRKGQKGWYRNFGFFYIEVEPKGFWVE